MSYISRAKEAITLAEHAEKLSEFPGGEWWSTGDAIYNEDNSLVANTNSPSYSAFIAESKTLVREMAQAIKLLIRNSAHSSSYKVTIHKSKPAAGHKRVTICKQRGADIAVAENWADVTCKKCWHKVEFVEKE